MQAGWITVARRSHDDIRMRQLVVSIDGKTEGTLMFGDEMTREVDSGAHRLRVHNTLVWKTVDFELAAGEKVRFICSNRAGFGTYSMIGLLGVGPLYVTITRNP